MSSLDNAAKMAAAISQRCCNSQHVVAIEGDSPETTSVARNLDEERDDQSTQYSSSDESVSLSSVASMEEVGGNKFHAHDAKLFVNAKATSACTATNVFSSLNPPSCFKRLNYAMTVDFCSSGLPWSGMQCRSIIAGWSGALYLLPIFFDWSAIGKLWWVIQSILSVQADYVHAHHSSIWHGLDHIAAPLTFVTCAYRAFGGLHWMTAVYLSSGPVLLYILAGRAKDQLNLNSWKWCHFAFHVIGSVNVAVGLHLIHSRCNRSN